MPCLLFENQGAENSGYVTKEFLTDLARQTEGLDVNEWKEAREGRFEKELRAAQQRAEEDGVNSTPSLVVCGPDGQVTLRGAVPIEDVDAAIQEAGGYWAFARVIRGVSAPGSRWVGS
jgi:predicted DsbA family dithiol-disulfide isomerase